MTGDAPAPTDGTAGRSIEPDQHIFSRLNIQEAPPRRGTFAMQMAVGPHVVNNRGGLQGGLVATLADVAAGCALMYDLPPGKSAATADLNMHFLSAVTEGPALADVIVVRRGKRTIVVQVEIFDVGRDVLCAIATLTFSLLDLRPGQREIRTQLQETVEQEEPK
jgi:uncharacterized protein (TIGR00369 family)